MRSDHQRLLRAAGFHDITRYPEAEQVPGVLILRWDAPLFFANASLFRDMVRERVADTTPAPRWILLAAEPITDVDTTAAELGSDERVIERVRHELDKQRRLVAAAGAEGDPVIQHDDQYRSLSLALIGRRREALLELRDEQRIDDIVLRRVQTRLDQEEVRFLRANPLE